MGASLMQLFSKVTIDNLSEETIIKYHRLLRAVLNRAIRYGLVDRNIAVTEATSPKSPHRKIRQFDLYQAKAFRVAALDEADIRIKTMVILLLYTGIRRGELCGLSWGDIHTESNQIDICRASQYICHKGIIEGPPKTESSIRTINVGQECMDVIKQYAYWWRKEKLRHGRCWKGELEHLFIQENGSPISPETVGRWMKQFITRNELLQLTPHGMRHMFISVSIAQGTDIITLKARTGHSDTSTLLDIYSHPLGEAQVAAGLAYEAALQP